DAIVAGQVEVNATISRLFTYAAWADKHDGAVHDVPLRGVALAMHEPIGVVGVACPDPYPLLGLVSLVAPLVATGNRVVVVPSARFPLAATDFYSVLETSDLPAGVINIVTGQRDALARTLADHDDVDAVWYFGSRVGATAVEKASAANLKRTWTEWTGREWLDPRAGEGRDFLRRAVQVKNIWIPYGE
ncbi:MAG: aldehyde dehydrogenase family protein, partial [Gemmatimonadaceae bacterium]|nr:aldehyde dehydrogenase family protein [Gemmatimonadaceae bacterium]